MHVTKKAERQPKGAALFLGIAFGSTIGLLAGFSGGVYSSLTTDWFVDFQRDQIETKSEVKPKPEKPVVKSPKTEKPKKPVSPVELKQASFATLPGWENDKLDGFELAFKRSCQQILKRPPANLMGRGKQAIHMTYGDWGPVCETFLNQEISDLKPFLEQNFTPLQVFNETDPSGKFTGYFEAELRGSRVKTDKYKYPIYGRPKDLVSVNLGQFSADLKGRSLVGRVNEKQKFAPYFERRSIEAGQLDPQNLELLYIDDAVDVFLLQVQGSGRVILPDGEVVRVGYAAHNGHGYKSIGRYLIENGEIEAHKASWGGIRNWIEKNPERQAELFAQNPRFIFFRELHGDGPIGSQGVALTPRRSLAVDQRYIPLGLPIWLDTIKPGNSTDPLQTLMVTQDTGGAIKGVIRGDFFWGYGDKALAHAGKMNSQGQYYILLPKPLAMKLLN